MAKKPSDFEDEIIPDKRPEHIALPRDIFLPWHKVRKQYIREIQWNRLAISLVERVWKSNLTQLRCLVIPGDDLLDIRSLWAVLRPKNLRLRYLGFHEGAGSKEVGSRVYISNNAVTSLDRVESDSQVIRDRFEIIANQDSQGYRNLKEYGPYHVVNLDLCGSMFPNTAKASGDYFDAINSLIDYQLNMQPLPWLLFLTTVVEPGLLDKSGMENLCKPTCENYDANVDFAKRMQRMFPEKTFDSASIDLSKLNEEHLIQLFGVAFGKWLLKLGQEANPKCAVNMKTGFRYVVNNPPKTAVMLSLAFVITPNHSPVVDQSGVSKFKPKSGRPVMSESDCAVEIANKAANMPDVDALLGENPSHRGKLLKAKADLLHEAGYDREAYIRWVEAGEKPQRNPASKVG